MMPKHSEGRYLPFLRAWRKKKFWSQQRLRDESHVSWATIQYLEVQKRPANDSTILKLAEALGIDPDTLVSVNPSPDEVDDADEEANATQEVTA